MVFTIFTVWKTIFVVSVAFIWQKFKSYNFFVNTTPGLTDLVTHEIYNDGGKQLARKSLETI